MLFWNDLEQFCGPKLPLYMRFNFKDSLCTAFLTCALISIIPILNPKTQSSAHDLSRLCPLILIKSYYKIYNTNSQPTNTVKWPRLPMTYQVCLYVSGNRPLKVTAKIFINSGLAFTALGFKPEVWSSVHHFDFYTPAVLNKMYFNHSSGSVLLINSENCNT